jgi:hypothetical protein
MLIWKTYRLQGKIKAWGNFYLVSMPPLELRNSNFIKGPALKIFTHWTGYIVLTSYLFDFEDHSDFEGYWQKCQVILKFKVYLVFSGNLMLITFIFCAMIMTLMF